MTASESTFYILVALLLCLLVSTKSDDVQWPLSLPHNFHRSLREKCPNAKFFQVCIFSIRTEYGDWRSQSPFSVWIQENTDQKKLRIWILFKYEYQICTVKISTVEMNIKFEQLK